MPNVIALAGTAALLGFAHVLTGPDHLSALATLSANVGSCKQAFFLGVQWGVGHSAGLLLVGIILIVATSSNQNDTIQIPKQATIFFETMVGIFMISLGSWGVRRALVKRSKISNLLSPSEGGSGIFVEDMDIESTNVHSHDHGFSFSNNITQRSHPSGDTDTVSPDCVTQQQGTSMEDEGEVLSSPTNRWTRLLSGLSTRTLAFIAGVIHGIAGPGGILGVLPAVQLHNGWLAVTFLGSFCFVSTLTMGVFASIYGAVTSRFVAQHGFLVVDASHRREFWVEFISSSLSIFVGILWIILLATGTLGKIFP